ncbi:MAG: hypothetical protein AUK19_01085 [Candidatus Moranbacteria bacterium CG2_30_45_14]|nr:MAG: hypothetical protein AUK19_01085 [Candidatus Moranbacteria bacterium CG2_30_45_14]
MMPRRAPRRLPSTPSTVSNLRGLSNGIVVGFPGAGVPIQLAGFGMTVQSGEEGEEGAVAVIEAGAFGTQHPSALLPYQ